MRMASKSGCLSPTLNSSGTNSGDGSKSGGSTRKLRREAVDPAVAVSREMHSVNSTLQTFVGGKQKPWMSPQSATSATTTDSVNKRRPPLATEYLTDSAASFSEGPPVLATVGPGKPTPTTAPSSLSPEIKGTELPPRARLSSINQETVLPSPAPSDASVTERKDDDNTRLGINDRRVNSPAVNQQNGLQESAQEPSESATILIDGETRQYSIQNPPDEQTISATPIPLNSGAPNEAKKRAAEPDAEFEMLETKRRKSSMVLTSTQPASSPLSPLTATSTATVSIPDTLLVQRGAHAPSIHGNPRISPLPSPSITSAREASVQVQATSTISQGRAVAQSRDGVTLQRPTNTPPSAASLSSTNLPRRPNHIQLAPHPQVTAFVPAVSSPLTPSGGIPQSPHPIPSQQALEPQAMQPIPVRGQNVPGVRPQGDCTSPAIQQQQQQQQQQKNTATPRLIQSISNFDTFIANEKPGTFNPIEYFRFRAIRDAILAEDWVFIILHQIYSMAGVNTRILFDFAGVTVSAFPGLLVLEDIFHSNTKMRAKCLGFCSEFPILFGTEFTQQAWYQNILKIVKGFLREGYKVIHGIWTFCLQRKALPNMDEFRKSVKLRSPIFLQMLHNYFASQLNKEGPRQQHLLQLQQLQQKVNKYPNQGPSPRNLVAQPQEQPSAPNVTESPATPPQLAYSLESPQRQYPGGFPSAAASTQRVQGQPQVDPVTPGMIVHPVGTANQHSQHATPNFTIPPQFFRQMRSGIEAGIGQQVRPGMEAGVSQQQVRPGIEAGLGQQQVRQVLERIAQGCDQVQASHEQIQAQAHAQELSAQRPSQLALRRSQGMVVPSPINPSIVSTQAVQSPPTPVSAGIGGLDWNTIVGSTRRQTLGPLGSVHRAQMLPSNAAHILPTGATQQLEKNLGPEYFMQSHLTSPSMTPPQSENGTMPLDLYISITDLPLKKLVLTSKKPTQKWTWNAPEDVDARLSKTKTGPGPNDRPKRPMVSPGSLIYRARCIKVLEPAAAPEEAQWVISETAWPENVFIEVNGEMVELRRKVQWGKDMPADITNFVKPGKNELKVVMLGDLRDNKLPTYVMAIEMFECVPEKQIIGDLLSKRLISAESAKAKITGRMQNSGNSDNLVVNKNLILSVRCPVSLSLMVLPVRGACCQHLDCFDYHSFLKTRPRRKEWEPPNAEGWKCPICGGDARPSQLVVDGFMWDVVKSLRKEGNEGVQRVGIDEGGSWKAMEVNEENEENKGKKEVETICLDD